MPSCNMWHMYKHSYKLPYMRKLNTLFAYSSSQLQDLPYMYIEYYRREQVWCHLHLDYVSNSFRSSRNQQMRSLRSQLLDLHKYCWIIMLCVCYWIQYNWRYQGLRSSKHPMSNKLLAYIYSCSYMPLVPRLVQCVYFGIKWNLLFLQTRIRI